MSVAPTVVSRDDQLKDIAHRIERDPQSITDADLDFIGFWGGDRARYFDRWRRSYEQHRTARPQTVATVKAQKIAEAQTETRTENALTHEEWLDTLVSIINHDGEPDIAAPDTKYDREHFLRALNLYYHDAHTLTDGDLQQLTVVNGHLGKRARLRRDGVKAPTYLGDDRALPIWFFRHYTWDHLEPFLGTVLERMRELRQRVAYLEAGGESSYVKALEARVAVLEVRPTLEYKGIWQAGEFYQLGNAVTKDGSVWISRLNNTRGEPGKDPTSWQLAVKRGRDGRDTR